jgi:hypothetical protein
MGTSQIGIRASVAALGPCCSTHQLKKKISKGQAEGHVRG